MGDMGDMYRDWDAAKKQKRHSNRKSSTELLAAHGYWFEEKNWGAHLIVQADHGVVIDFWPSTGRWIARTSRGGHAQKGRGVQNLMKCFPPRQMT